MRSYERQIAELTRELERRQGAPPPLHGAASGSHPVHAAPPAIGQGPRELFGQIMSGGGQQGSLAPPPSQPTQQPGLPAHLTQGMGSHTGPQPPQHQPYPEYAASGVNGTSLFVLFCYTSLAVTTVLLHSHFPFSQKDTQLVLHLQPHLVLGAADSKVNRPSYLPSRVLHSLIYFNHKRVRFAS